MGWMSTGRVELRYSILVAMGLAGCSTRALGPDSGDEQGEDDSDDGSSGEDDGSTGSSASTTDATSATSTSATSTSATSTSATSTSATGTSTSTSTTDSGTDTGIPTCEVDPEVWQQIMICMAPVGGECIPCDEDQACRSAAEAAQAEACMPEFQYTVCGPELVGDACCSVVFVEDWGCAGRPFIVAGDPKSALPCARDDWHAGVKPRCDALGASIREHLGASWRAAALAEHASIASFARFVLDLLAAGAPADLVASAQAATADEIVHARLAFGLASAYLGASIGPGPLAVEGAFGSDRDLAAIVRAVIIEGCVGETVSAARAELALEGCSDPAVRRALATIARDERRHAQLAWQFVDWALRREPTLRDVVADTFTLALVGIELAPSSAAGPGPDDALWRAHGVLPDHEVAAVTRVVAVDVIAPCFAALLEGKRAIAA